MDQLERVAVRVAEFEGGHMLKQRNDTVFQKTLAFSDYYFGADDWEFPLGLVQMCAASHGVALQC